MVPEYSARQIAADLGLFGAIGLALGAIHVAIPESVTGSLVVGRDTAGSLSLVTAAYVHADTAHLLDNLLGYAVCGSAAYALCLAAGRRSWFRWTALSYLLFLPVLVNAFVLLVLRGVYDLSSVAVLGFSSVVAGFAGLLLVAQAVLFYAKWDRPAATASTAALLFAFLAISVRVAIPDPPAWALPATLSGVLLSGLALAVHASRHGGPRDLDGWLQFGVEAATVAGVLALLSWFVLTMFAVTASPSPSPSPFALDVTGHVAGFLLGVVFALLFERLTRDSSGSADTALAPSLGPE